MTDRYLGFNPGLNDYCPKLKHRTRLVFCLQKVKTFFRKNLKALALDLVTFGYLGFNLGLISAPSERPFLSRR